MPHLSNEPKTTLQLAIQHAAWERAEITRFQSAWMPLPQQSRQMPGFSWAELERQLQDLAPQESKTATTLVSAIRKQADFKPPEMVLREVLIAASVLMDEGFSPQWEDSDAEEGQMT